MEQKRKGRTIILGISLATSIILSIVIWFSIGKQSVLKEGHLDIDFFNTICGVFGIVGLFITIYQILELIKIEDARMESYVSASIKSFKTFNLNPINEVLKSIGELRDLINNSDYDKQSFINFVNKVNEVKDKMNRIDSHQVSMNCGEIIECKRGIKVLEDLRGSFSKIIDEDLYLSVTKITYTDQIDELIALVKDCQIELQKS